MNRHLNLTERLENVREQQEVRHVVHFNLQEIKDRFDESILSIEQKFSLYDTLMEERKENEAKDILRSQIIFLEGVIDFYLHEMTKYSYFKMFINEWDKTQQYKNFTIKMENVEKGLNSGGSKEWFFEYVSTTFERVVFLSRESMKDQLNAIGIPYKEVMCQVFLECNEKNSIQKGNDFIKKLFQRRNAIAHQNDRSHDSAMQSDIDKEYVRYSIDVIKKIAQEIYTIANAK